MKHDCCGAGYRINPLWRWRLRSAAHRNPSPTGSAARISGCCASGGNVNVLAAAVSIYSIKLSGGSCEDLVGLVSLDSSEIEADTLRLISGRTESNLHFFRDSS